MKRLEVDYYGEMGYVNFIYFFEQDELIFAGVNLVEYNMPMYIEEYEVVSEKVDIFYFEDGEMIKWESDYEEDTSKCNEEFQEWEVQIIESIEDVGDLI